MTGLKLLTASQLLPAAAAKRGGRVVALRRPAKDTATRRPCLFRLARNNPIYLAGILLFLSASFAFAAFTPPAQPAPLSPEKAAREGMALANEILAQAPAQNTTNTGVMTVRDANDERREIPVRFEVFTTATNWISRYEAKSSNHTQKFTVAHSANHPNEYFETDSVSTGNPLTGGNSQPLSGKAIWGSFAGSDFSVADLGLEFFHWPEQHLIKKEMKRSRACQVLESINPHPAPGGYSRVVSWIDNESDGIVMAHAYDTHGNLLKEFIPQKFEKINGQWQLERMEIDNDQTGSSTQVKFDLPK